MFFRRTSLPVEKGRWWFTFLLPKPLQLLTSSNLRPAEVKTHFPLLLSDFAKEKFTRLGNVFVHVIA